MRKEDQEGNYMNKYNLKSLEMISIAGECLDETTFKWIQGLHSDVIINNNYWQTETGWPISTNFKDLHLFGSKSNSCYKPTPGYDVKILDE